MCTISKPQCRAEINKITMHSQCSVNASKKMYTKIYHVKIILYVIRVHYIVIVEMDIESGMSYNKIQNSKNLKKRPACKLLSILDV